MRKIFLDMDGVLVDFDGFFKRVFGKSYVDLHKPDAWKHVESIPNFFRNLPPLSNAQRLFTEVSSRVHHPTLVEILTAKPKRTGHLISCPQDKEFWIRTHISKDVFVNCVDGWDHKKFFCQPGDILIDDSPRNCTDWENAGGVAILYDDAQFDRVLAELNHHHIK